MLHEVCYNNGYIMRVCTIWRDLSCFAKGARNDYHSLSVAGDQTWTDARTKPDEPAP